MAEIFPYFVKRRDLQIQGQQTPNRINSKQSLTKNIKIKLLKTKDKEKHITLLLLKPAREKCHITNRQTTIQMIEDFLSHALKAKKQWKDIFEVLKENCKPRIL